MQLRIPLLLALLCPALSRDMSAQLEIRVASERRITDGHGGFGGDIDAFDQFGCAVSIGDLDGDGVIDLAIGSIGDDDGAPVGSTGVGAVYVAFLNSDGTVRAEQKISNTQGGFGGALVGQFGESLACVGDLDDDGVQDLAVGDIGEPPGGAIWILFLNPDGTVKGEQKISGTSGGFTGVLANGGRFGQGLAGLGDLDGDGVEDVAVGSPLDPGLGLRRGAVWILLLNTDGTVKAHQRIDETSGGFGGVLQDSDTFGVRLATIGDLDGDGVVDLAVGAKENVGTGEVWVLFLNADGTVKSEQRINALEGGFSGTLHDGDAFCRVSAVGDLDRDGVVDLAVGANRDSDGGTWRGAVWILFLHADGTVKCQEKISDTAGWFAGALSNFDQFGYGVSSVGDLDGNGIVDLAIWAPGDDSAGDAAGATWLVFLQEKTKVILEPNGPENGGTIMLPSMALRESCLVARTPPRIGHPWLVDVDTSMNPWARHTLVRLLDRPEVGTVLFTGFGSSSGEVDRHEIPIPDDPSLVGHKLYVQSAVLGRGFTPCLTVEVTIRD